MKPIFNAKMQVVSENYLRAVLNRVSGIAHRYWIESMSTSYCTVAYSNPDEYGNETPVHLRFPMYRGFQGYSLIVMHPGTSSHGRDPDDREAAADMMADVICSVPNLYRNSLDGEWYTREEQTKTDITIAIGRVITPHDPHNGQPGSAE